MRTLIAFAAAAVLVVLPLAEAHHHAPQHLAGGPTKPFCVDIQVGDGTVTVCTPWN